MAWRQRGQTSVDPQSPRAFGVCDRCGRWYNLTRLRWQFDWRGNALVNLWLRVCPPCYDTPQEQLRPRILPPDPVPVYQPRPENFTQDNGPAPSTAPVNMLFGVPVDEM